MVRAGTFLGIPVYLAGLENAPDLEGLALVILRDAGTPDARYEFVRWTPTRGVVSGSIPASSISRGWRERKDCRAFAARAQPSRLQNRAGESGSKQEHAPRAGTKLTQGCSSRVPAAEGDGMGEMMKLYVWCDPYSVPYGSSMVFAVASNLKEARRLAAESPTLWSYGKFSGRRYNTTIRLEKPDRVVKLPCAEWHEWPE